jgi:hypothetical protein
MPPRMLSPAEDPVRPHPAEGLQIVVDGEPFVGVSGQTIAGVLLANGVVGWRTTARHGRPRGVFCGIGVCFDCTATVNDLTDVRCCQRRAADGDVVVTPNGLTR